MIPVGNDVFIQSPSGTWRGCLVLRHDSFSRKLLVHYNSFSSEHDEWIPNGSRRIFPYPVDSMVLVESPAGRLCTCKVLRLSSHGGMLVHYLGSVTEDEWIDYGSPRIGPNLEEVYPTGSRISILSPKLAWRNCTVRSHDLSRRCLLVHYHGFDKVCDEWIGYGSVRISPNVEDAPLVGTTVTVRSSAGLWHRCTVVQHHDKQHQFLVHYDDFPYKEDEWIECGSDRLAPTLEELRPVGCKVSVRSPSDHWRTCEVLRHDAPRSRLFIKYDGFSSRFNEWVEYESKRLEPRKLPYPGPKFEDAASESPDTIYRDLL